MKSDREREKGQQNTMNEGKRDNPPDTCLVSLWKNVIQILFQLLCVICLNGFQSRRKLPDRPSVASLF